MSRSLGFILLGYLILWYSLALRGGRIDSSFQENLEQALRVFLVTGLPALLVAWLRSRTIIGMLWFLLVWVTVATIIAELWYG